MLKMYGVALIIALALVGFFVLTFAVVPTLFVHANAAAWPFAVLDIAAIVYLARTYSVTNDDKYVYIHRRR